MRTLLSVLLIGVPVTLILTLVGLSHGMLEDAQNRTRGVGADIIVRPPGTSLLTLSGAPIPEALVNYLGKLPHVTIAVGVVNFPIQTALVAIGVDVRRFDAMSGGFTYLQGGPFNGPDQVIIDQYYAAQQHVHAGGTISLLNRDWKVVGVIAGGKLARIVFPIQVLQNLTSNAGKVSQVYLKLDNPQNTSSVIHDLKARMPDYQIYSMQEFTSLFNVSNIQGLRQFITVIMGVGVIIGFAVVCLSMYMAVLQRTREIGILKSLGGSKIFILQIILLEALLLGVGGSILGILLSFGAYWLIQTLVPASIQMAIVPIWWGIASGITLLGAALGALYPGISAARHDPIEALAYE